MYITEAEIDSIDRVVSNKYTAEDLAATHSAVNRLRQHEIILTGELARIQEIVRGLDVITQKLPVPRTYRQSSRMWISKLRSELPKDQPEPVVRIGRSIGFMPPEPTKTVQQPAVDSVDRVFTGCHLELRNLDAAETCGKCGKPAGEHRYHKSNRPRE